ncbi:hypothetical protein ACTWQB_04325 [Piscibacillus sp. B03]|uniref:hypothetical protein n=1 Tax=Piscibacillus sp. B03 TaxID=3457430 RepID=UPI003FCCE064
MIENQFTIQDAKNKSLRLRAERMANYVRAQIVEAISDEHDLYYLFFYKGEFLTAKKVTKLRRHSFIETAFKHGHVYQSPHPFMNHLLTSNHSAKIINNKQLLRKLNQHYSKTEKAYILTFFESFISKKQLFEEIKDMFYEDRRGGQLFTAYQLIRILKDFAPKHSLVKSLSSDLIYKDFAKMYRDRDSELFSQDLIEAEKIMFHEIETCQDQYVQHLMTENRPLELSMLLYEQMKKAPSSATLDLLHQTLQENFTDNESVQLLERLAEQVKFASLQELLLKKYLDLKQIDRISLILLETEVDLTPNNLEQLTRSMSEISPNELNMQPEALQNFILKLLKHNPSKADPLLTKCLIKLLASTELNDVNDWIRPFRELCGKTKAIEQFDKMFNMSEDLESMQPLGELYFEFEQWDQALECFSMESELKPDAAKPLKWLSKTYLEMGLKDESEAYQKMYVSVQKQA